MLFNPVVNILSLFGNRVVSNQLAIPSSGFKISNLCVSMKLEILVKVSSGFVAVLVTEPSIPSVPATMFLEAAPIFASNVDCC